MAGNRKPMRNFKDDDNSFDEEPLSSPGKKQQSRNVPSHFRQNSSNQAHKSVDAASEQHDASLRQELANVRKVNEAIEGVLESLDKAKSNMRNVNNTVGNASTLLNIWTRILSQTEHNQRLILDPTWQGASHDVAEMENEAQAKQQAAEKREAEEQERKAAATRKAEEDERKQTEVSAAISKPRAGARGRASLSRGKRADRAGHTVASGTVSTGTSSETRGIPSTRRPTSGIGRGPASRITRGRE